MSDHEEGYEHFWAAGDVANVAGMRAMFTVRPEDESGPEWRAWAFADGSFASAADVPVPADFACVVVDARVVNDLSDRMRTMLADPSGADQQGDEPLGKR